METFVTGGDLRCLLDDIVLQVTAEGSVNHNTAAIVGLFNGLNAKEMLRRGDLRLANLSRGL